MSVRNRSNFWNTYSTAGVGGTHNGILYRPLQELAVVGRCITRPHLAPVSVLCLLAGLLYPFSSIDFIPNRLPYVGHLDDVGLVLVGLLACRWFAPYGFLATGMGDRRREALQTLAFGIRVLRADFANFFLVQYRGVDGFLITGKNSGTHWLKFMLSCAIARQFGVAAPVHSSGQASNTIIGHPRWPRPAGVPRIASSHTIPSIAFAWRLRLLNHGPVVVLVRDPRQAMLSNYLKWNALHDESLAAYVQGDPSGRRHVADVWWYIHFFNRWGAVARARPGHTLIVHYEDLEATPGVWLARIGRHLGVSLSEAAVRAGLDYADRDAVAARLDPTFCETIIPAREHRAAIAFGGVEEAAFRAILARHLRYDLGYDLPMRRGWRAAGQDAVDGGLAAE